MKKIFKYELDIVGEQEIEVPLECKILSVDSQEVDHIEGLYCWALVNPENPAKQKKTIRMMGTGHPIPDDMSKMQFIGTVKYLHDKLIWHVFEEKK